MDNPPIFNSVEDECRFWKERAKSYHKEWTDVKMEYEEYITHSRDTEEELDFTLEQKQSIIKDLELTNHNLVKENDLLKRKIDLRNSEYTDVEGQLDEIKKERETMKDYLRRLEQKHDDLERAHRILKESFNDFERMLNKAYEKNALLELEVDEKEVLQEKLQRLMDETRDLKQELNVKSTRYSGALTINGHLNSPTEMVTTSNGLHNGNIITLESNCNGGPQYDATIMNSNCNSESYSQQQRSLKRKPFAAESDNLLNGNAMLGSSRTNALNIVADMLRKLNAMEAKLKTHREQNAEAQPRQ